MIAQADIKPAAVSGTLVHEGQGELVNDDGTVAVMITLQGDPAVVDYAQALRAGGGSGPVAERAAGSASRAAVAALQSRQAEFSTRLLASGIPHTELFRTTRVLNGIAVNMNASDMPQVARMAGVKHVRFLPRHWPTNGSSVPFVGAPQFWEGTPLGMAGLKGEGIRVGIIDTGVDYQHPDFGGSGVLADYQGNDTTIITDPAVFPTPKVIGGWDFVGNAYTGSNTPAPDPDPMDCNGHGSHVAGSAAGLGVRTDNTAYNGPWDTTVNYGNLKIGPGVAPRASIYALRVFGCGGSTNVTVAAIERATDPNDDGDLSDRLDVINMSLGSNFGLPEDDSAEASDNATLTGMIVVASAGNAGDTFFISGSPGSAKSAISTANVLDSGLPGPLLVNAPAAIAGYRTTGSASFGTAPPLAGLTAEVVRVDDGSTLLTGGTINDGCQTPYVNAAAVAGKIALVDRGACGFKLKAFNAIANGAVGVIIGNVASSATPGTAPGMADDPTVGAVNGPTVSLNLADADGLRTQLGLPAVVNVTLNVGADTPSASTSRGPGGVAGQIYLKPEIAAPGSSITSAQTGITCNGTTTTGCQVANASGFIPAGAPLILGGTSMAAPHVAGFTALLRQQNPGASVEQIKAIAMNSAAHDITVGPNGLLDTFPGSRVGAGRIDIPRSVSPISAGNADEPKQVAVTFNNYVIGTASETKQVRLQNRTATVQNVTLELDPLLNSPGVAFALTGPTTVSVPPSGSVLVPVQMTATAADMDRSRDPTLAATQSQGAPASVAALGALPRHYLGEESANLIVKKAGNEVARVPVYMAHRPHSDMAGPNVIAPSGATVDVPLSGTGVCTGTLTGSDCTGNFGTTDQVSLVSPFELQYTGAVDAQLPGFANIHYLGVNHDSASDAYLFGVATHGPWGSPTHVAFNICVDNDEDGNYDRVIASTNLGGLARLMVNATIYGQDVFVNTVFTPPSSLAFGGPTTYVNQLSAAQADTALLANNVAVVSATGTQLGLTAGNTNFRYAVAVCPGFNPLCVRLTTPNQCDAPGSTYATVPGPFSYDSANKGITSSGGAAGAILFQDLPGAELSLGYNQANMTTNGSSGLLLLHHHNAPADTAQVIATDGIFADGFDRVFTVPGVTVNEGFDDVSTLEGAGWIAQNNSSPVGGTGWSQGFWDGTDVFQSQAGADDAYLSANFNNTTGAGTIDNWLVSPPITFNSNTSMSFWTRVPTGSIYPDRLEVRLCAAPPCTAISPTATAQATFPTLLTSINPTLVQGGYPDSWAQFTVNNASGIPVSGTGRIAFRYWVTNGGPSGDNSNYIGIDTLSITAAAIGTAPAPGVGTGFPARGAVRGKDRK